jgi:DNA-binding HxlR family transcriptional regulator
MTEVLFGIEEGNNRFTTLKDELEHISDNILADRLKLLEEYKLISKESFSEIPARVEYTLTDTGRELSNILEKLCDFSDTCMLSHQQAAKKY